MIDNLITEGLLLFILMIMIIVNTILGAFLASKKQEFDIKKLFKGLLKSFIISFCIFLFCFTLEIIPLVLNRINVSVSADLVTSLEVILTTFTAYKKYVVDCFDKMKTILNMEEI